MGTAKRHVPAGVIDIGSGSVKLTIGERHKSGVRVVETLKNPLPLGRHAFLGGTIPHETVNRTVGILETYQRSLAEYGVADVRVIATTAVREARDSDVFIDLVQRRTGMRVEVLTAGDVIFYIDSYLSHRLRKSYPIRKRKVLIAELGAGSLDLSVMDRGYALTSAGLPIGTLRIRQLQDSLAGGLAETEQALIECIDREFRCFSRFVPDAAFDDVILIDENYTSFLERFMPPASGDRTFFRFGFDRADRLLAAVEGKTPAEITADLGVPPEYADTVFGYAAILHRLRALTRKKSIFVLTASLAEAVLSTQLFRYDRTGDYSRARQLTAAARAMCEKYRADTAHAGFVVTAAGVLFDALAPSLDLAPRDRLYLELAAWLHDIGLFVHNRSHHKHAEYLINASDMFRLSDEERRTVACVARYHRKAQRMRNHAAFNTLPPSRRLAVRKLSALLAVANALDASHRQKMDDLSVEYDPDRGIGIRTASRHNLLLETAALNRKKKLLEDLTGCRVRLAAGKE